MCYMIVIIIIIIVVVLLLLLLCKALNTVYNTHVKLIMIIYKMLKFQIKFMEIIGGIIINKVQTSK